jgi:hypothetical protein
LGTSEVGISFGRKTEKKIKINKRFISKELFNNTPKTLKAFRKLETTNKRENHLL